MAEAVVIGGGVMGLGAARELRRRGYTVTMLERAQPGRAASWASAGIIGATLRDEADPQFAMRRLSHEMWPAFAQQLLEESGLDPEYRETGCLYLAVNGEELTGLDVTVQRAARRHASQTDTVTRLDAAALRQIEPAIASSVAGALLVRGGNVENRRLCRALEIAARRAGVRILSGQEVRVVVASGGRATGVETSSGEHHAADLVVLAAGAWSGLVDGVEPPPPVHPQRGQILALDQTAVGLKHVLLTAGDPYFVPRADGRLVIGATREEAGWDAQLTAGGVAWLLRKALHVVPGLNGCPIVEMWTGFRPLSVDGLPLIGRGALDGLYFLTGHGPSGIAPLPGSIALLAALIAGEPPPVAPEAFDPLRFRR